MTKLEELAAKRDAAVDVYYAGAAGVAYDAAYDAAEAAEAAYKAELKKQDDGSFVMITGS
tara:strand:- start:947 stop:1126 length:180 start_codon:yes stop_codon:yes gene_type:complete